MVAAKSLRQAASDSPALVRILDAAEYEITAYGYAGAGMKAIATRAGVAQGLLHYHFGNKEGLYEAVIARRARRLSDAREALLAQVDLMAPDALEQVFDALYRPNFEEEGGGKAYAAIFDARFVSDSDAAHLVNKYYDPTASRFIDAIIAVDPSIPRDAASWSYTLAIGSLFAGLMRNGRQERLAGVPVRDPDGPPDPIINALVQNSVGGLKNLVAAAPARGKTQNE